jgi:hypothetical protein
MAASRLVELGQQGFRRRSSGRCSHGTFFQVSAVDFGILRNVEARTAGDAANGRQANSVAASG